MTFLDLLGVRLFPPTAARAQVTFWLSAPQPDTVRIAEGHPGRHRPDGDRRGHRLQTTEELADRPCELSPRRLDGRRQDASATTARRSHKRSAFFCFSAAPKPAMRLYVGLTEAVPSCAVTLRFGCQIEGVGVDPDCPPLAWEAWDGEAGRPASSSATRPAGSTGTATS